MQYNEKALYDIIVGSLAKQDFKKAIAACRQLNNHYPNCFEGWLIAGDIHRKYNKPLAGLFSTEKALSIRPGEPRATLQRIECLIAEERIEEAIALLTDLAKANGKNKNTSVDTLDRTGRLLASEGLHREAKGQYEIAIKKESDNPALYYNLATALRFLGNMQEAEFNLNKCLTLNPLDFEAQAMRSSLRKQSSTSNNIRELESLLDDNKLAEQGKVNICYALAKEFDDIDNGEKSFHYLRMGASTRRRQMSYDVQADVGIIECIKSTYDSSIINKIVKGFDSSEPIFIIGLPRTGTTLVERILGSHDDVFAAGELDNFGRKLSELVLQNNQSAKTPMQIVQQSTHLNFNDIGHLYIDSTRPATGHTKRFIDKLPFNFLYTGLIHSALPSAKIINITRHPMAACYAIYKQLFRDVYPYSYDLNDLAQYYIAYHQLMTHWHEILPGVMYDLSYEDVINDLERESRDLLAFCQLPWQDQCLRFYENKQASTTASASQVRQPIYNRSLDRWREYSQQLQPLKQILQDAGINCD